MLCSPGISADGFDSDKSETGFGEQPAIIANAPANNKARFLIPFTIPFRSWGNNQRAAADSIKGDDICCFHADGADIAFADGSVKLAKDSVTIVVLARLVTKAGGEVIDPNGY